MVTIEERAKEYAYFNMRDLEVELDEAMSFVENAYKDGAKEERALLTEWRNPKEELPEDGVDVLVKCVSGSYVVDFYAAELGCFFGEHATYMQVVGWRPIEE